MLVDPHAMKSSTATAVLASRSFSKVCLLLLLGCVPFAGRVSNRLIDCEQQAPRIAVVFGARKVFLAVSAHRALQPGLRANSS